jgi:soluble lytic murein transglycosylase-like protein
MKNRNRFPLFKYAKPAAASQSAKKPAPQPRREITEMEKGITFAQLMALQRAAEKKYGLPNKMLAMTAYLESRGDPGRISNKGAQGIYQILPSVVKDPAELQKGKKDKTAYYIKNLYDLEESTNAVAQHLADAKESLLGMPNVDKYKGLGFDRGWELVALEYIAGRGNIAKWLAAGAPTEPEKIAELKKLNKYTSAIGPQSLDRLKTMKDEMQSGSFDVERLRPAYEAAMGKPKIV